MDPTTFDEPVHPDRIRSDPAIDALCDRLRTQGDYGALFYALLMKKRFELGVSPIPTGASAELPNEVHMAYEDAILAVPLAWSVSCTWTRSTSPEPGTSST